MNSRDIFLRVSASRHTMIAAAHSARSSSSDAGSSIIRVATPPSAPSSAASKTSDTTRSCSALCASTARTALNGASKSATEDGGTVLLRVLRFLILRLGVRPLFPAERAGDALLLCRLLPASKHRDRRAAVPFVLLLRVAPDLDVVLPRGHLAQLRHENLREVQAQADVDDAAFARRVWRRRRRHRRARKHLRHVRRRALRPVAVRAVPERVRRHATHEP
eukprot:31232-Pelagococcus_subviridis.AAC.15